MFGSIGSRVSRERRQIGVGSYKINWKVVLIEKVTRKKSPANRARRCHDASIYYIQNISSAFCCPIVWFDCGSSIAISHARAGVLSESGKSST
jgi:hypothetical protein